MDQTRIEKEKTIIIDGLSKMAPPDGLESNNFPIGEKIDSDIKTTPLKD